ncbi:hsp70-Hsp90 organizing protein 3-like [Solanum verrucosum]|uniref:hsp70-Hsp90 organizing protein 3-like n=1 Tax=Solanum verrucosum TaxID=315347 RepID=UPI0020D09A9F|nr:hsp70-Hsp90 organizing protein 3-like [Solanum verrucosum]
METAIIYKFDLSCQKIWRAKRFAVAGESYNEFSRRTNKPTTRRRKTTIAADEDEPKSKGNAAFASGNFTDAVLHLTEAINLSPNNHVLYSNRSAAYASLNKFSEALIDAEKTVELKPDWSKGYSRVGAAYLGLNNYNDAILAYRKGLKIDPNNEVLKSRFSDAQSGQGRGRGPSSSFGDAFYGPEMWAKLTSDPRTRTYLQQPDFVRMMQDIQKNPNNLNLYMKDQRVMQAFGVLLGMKWDTRTPKEGVKMPGGSPERKRRAESEPVKEEKRAGYKAHRVPQPKPVEVSEEEKELKERKVLALKEKEAGNAAYKKKDFENAVQLYTKAIELDDADISFLTNRAAVFLEMGKYEDCMKDCDKAVERGRELRSDYKMIARALTRKGTALVKMAKISKDYEPAIETFQKALTEHRNPETLKKLNEAEKAKKELEQQEYCDPQVADEEREKGNQFFKEQKYPEAASRYTESLRRNPKDPRTYSNRAACYTKLGALPEGLKDAEKCIELDATFAKGYTRNGAVQFFMKEFEKAMETYQAGLTYDPQNQELLDGVRRCVEQMKKTSRGDLTPEELKERQAKGMQDPEIQNILTDPVMGQVLADFQENPKAAQKHMKNPLVMNKIKKLISAGILQVK